MSVFQTRTNPLGNFPHLSRQPNDRVRCVFTVSRRVHVTHLWSTGHRCEWFQWNDYRILHDKNATWATRSLPSPLPDPHRWELHFRDLSYKHERVSKLPWRLWIKSYVDDRIFEIRTYTFRTSGVSYNSGGLQEFRPSARLHSQNQDRSRNDS